MIIGVTGASGFIGSHLLEVLRKKGHKPRIFDGDLLDADAVDAFAEGCEQVIHLAGVFSNDFLQLMNVNVIGTRNVVESCKKHGVKKIVFSSTGAVYGEPVHSDSRSREDDPLLPNTLYGLSKLYAEEYIRYSGVRFVTLRFPNVYGPGNRKGVIYNFIKSIKEDGKVIVRGTGEQRRDFLFVSDAVRALLSAVDYRGVESTFNISEESAHSLNDIIRLLDEAGYIFAVNREKSDESNALQCLSEDISRARKALMWSPSTDLKIGIGSVSAELDSYRPLRAAEDADVNAAI